MEEKMKKTLTFEISVKAPKQVVWEKMLSDETYRVWTAPFGKGSHFVGSWEEGGKIKFLGPGGEGGMISEIAESRPFDYISIRHLGEIVNGVEDTTSEKVKAWAPAYENYSFADEDGGTKLTVQLDTLADWEQFMNDTFPKALEVLKEICEREVRSADA